MDYNAIAFLEGHYQQPDSALANDCPCDSPAGKIFNPADLPPNWHFLWDERAAIMEFDGGLPRERAEAVALSHILEEMRQVEVSSGDTT